MIFYTSYTFYKISSSNETLNLIKPTDSLTIIKDTVDSFEKKISKLENRLSEKDTLINQLRNKNGRLQRIKDSIEYKEDFWKQKFKSKNTNDSVH